MAHARARKNMGRWRHAGNEVELPAGRESLSSHVPQSDPSSFFNGLPTWTPKESACLLPQRYRSVSIGLNVEPRVVSTYGGRDFEFGGLPRATNPDRCKSLRRSVRTLSLRPGSSCRSSL